MAVKNGLIRFATNGFRVQRLNPDGTIPRSGRAAGLHGTADLSGVTNNSVAELTIKVGSLAPQRYPVDFSDANDITRVTVQEIITAINTAGFTGVTASRDAATGRLLIEAAAGADGIIQIVGSLASALDFGQGRRHGGDLRCLSFFNDTTMSITLPKDIIEQEEIDIEGANGSPTRMVIGARTQGMSPVITIKEKNYDFLQLVQGGTLDRQRGRYDPPMPNESEHPSFWIEILSPVYGQGVNKQADMKGYECILLRNCMGWEGDVPIEAKAWAQYAYSITSIEYTDETGARFPAWQEQQLSIEQFDALGVNDISMTADELGNNAGIPENLSAAESREPESVPGAWLNDD